MKVLCSCIALKKKEKSVWSSWFSFPTRLLPWLLFLGVMVAPVDSKKNMCLSLSWCWPSKRVFYCSWLLFLLWWHFKMNITSLISISTDGIHQGDIIPILSPFLSFWMTSVIIMRSDEDIIFKIWEGMAKVNGHISELRNYISIKTKLDTFRKCLDKAENHMSFSED